MLIIQTNTTTAGQTLSDADAVNAAIAAINNRPAQKTGIPIAIHFICALSALGAGISAISLYIGGGLMGTNFFLYNYIVLLGDVLAIVWMWQLKKKGAYLYAGLFVIGQALLWGGDLIGIYLYPVRHLITGFLFYRSIDSVEIFITVISSIAAATVLYYSRRMK